MSKQYFKSKENLESKKKRDKKRNKIKRETARILLELELNEYAEATSKMDDLSRSLAAKVR